MKICIVIANYYPNISNDLLLGASKVLKNNGIKINNETISDENKIFYENKLFGKGIKINAKTRRIEKLIKEKKTVIKKIDFITLVNM